MRPPVRRTAARRMSVVANITDSERVLHWVQRRLLWLLLSMYALGAVYLSWGTRMRAVQFAPVPQLESAGPISLPMLMLGLILVVAGVGLGALT